MDWSELEGLIAIAVTEAPQLIRDVATGEGGLAKIAKIGGDLLEVVRVVQQAVITHPAAQPAAPLPPLPPEPSA